MKMLGTLTLATTAFLGFMNSPWTLVKKADLAALEAKVAETPAPVVQPPQAVYENSAPAPTPSPSGAWMWQDRSNPLDGHSYDQTSNAAAPPTYYPAGAAYYPSGSTYNSYRGTMSNPGGYAHISTQPPLPGRIGYIPPPPRTSAPTPIPYQYLH